MTDENQEIKIVEVIEEATPAGLSELAQQLADAKKAKEEAEKAFKDAETAFKEANKSLIEARDKAKKALDVVEETARGAVQAFIDKGEKPDHAGFTTRQTTEFVVTDESALATWLISQAPFIAIQVLKIDTKKLETLLNDNTTAGKLSPVLSPVGQHVKVEVKVAPQINWSKLV